jgi:putative transposase
MKKKRYSEEQIVRILLEAEKQEKSISEFCKLSGVSEQSYYRWKKKLGDMSVPDVKRLRVLEKENSQLKRLLAERDLEVDALKAVVSKKW